MTDSARTIAASVIASLVDLAAAEERAMHVVVAPGSRNAPLSIAAFEAATRGKLTLHTRIDERAAGFVALGLAKVTRAPIAVITTSGTAAANLHPAVLEAAHAGVRLVVITADRPARLRGTNANQTTDQRRLFGDAAVYVDVIDRAGWEAYDEAVRTLDGPLHVNVELDEPLLKGAVEPWHRTRRRPVALPPPRPVMLRPGPRTVVVAGDDAGPRARTLAEKAGWPVLAEPTSGARNGSHAIRTYRLLLVTELGDRIERVVVFGHPTLSRPVSALLGRGDVEVVSVRARGRWPERPFAVAAEHEAVEVGELVDAGVVDTSWLDEWRAADTDLGRRVDRFVASRTGLTPHEVAAAVNAAVPAGGLLHVGASNPIRDLDLMARAYPVGERRLIIANRGLAGIDGTLSTAIGAALGRPDSSRALVYLGDVTFLHDLTGLVIGPGEQRPDLTIVVANDDGGSIFATLEQGGPEFVDSFEKVFGTPTGVDIGTLCSGLRVPHWRVSDAAELEHALASPNGGIEVIEAVVRRDDRRELDAAIRGL